jgi:hypothetical protein
MSALPSTSLGNISSANFTPQAPKKSPFEGTKDFLESNSIVAKFAFLLLVLIVFILLLRLGIKVISYFMTPSSSPTLIDGMIDATQMQVIPQNPAVAHSVPVLRSVNQDEGIEFTWSVWTFIKNLSPENRYKHIFHKGNDKIDPTLGLNFPNNAPGLYIAPNSNNFVIIMNTFDKIKEEIVIEDIPLNKWISVIIRVENHNMDVYVNGVIVKRHILASVPKQNYGDVYASMNGGYNGFTSDLRYWNYALDIQSIQRIVNKGPNMKMKSTDVVEAEPRYFSLRWFFQNPQMDYGGL